MYYSIECGNIIDSYEEMIQQCRELHEFVMNVTDNCAWNLYFVKIS